MSFSIILSPFFVICLFTGVIFIISGWLFAKYPPRRINNWYGYRTPASKKNQERWDYAQKYSATLSIRMGWFMVLAAFTSFAININYEYSIWIGLATIFIVSVILIIMVEVAINRKFK